MRDPVQQEFIRDLTKSLFFIEPLGISLGFEIDLISPKQFPCRSDPFEENPAPQATAALDRDHTTDGDMFTFHSSVKDAKIGFDSLFILQPDVNGILITVVQFRINAILLYHKH